MKIKYLIVVTAVLLAAVGISEAKKVPCDPLMGDATAPAAKALNPLKTACVRRH
jgi:hypothetical protein